MLLDPATHRNLADAIHRFYYLVDDGEAANTHRFFEPDAVWVFGPGSPKPGTLRGGEIVEAMAARGAMKAAFSRHVVSNLLLSGNGDGTVKARYLLQLFRSDNEIRTPVLRLVADVTEDWRAIDGEWKILRRELLPSFYHTAG